MFSFFNASPKLEELSKKANTVLSTKGLARTGEPLSMIHFVPALLQVDSTFEVWRIMSPYAKDYYNALQLMKAMKPELRDRAFPQLEFEKQVVTRGQVNGHEKATPGDLLYTLMAFPDLPTQELLAYLGIEPESIKNLLREQRLAA